MTSNPFLNENGVGAVTVEDRLYRLVRFDLEQCVAALYVPGLQKTVERKLQARIRQLEKERSQCVQSTK
mgnify:CR=1 FL=1